MRPWKKPCHRQELTRPSFRVEDWPVMPVEIFQLHYKPADFFDKNPANDVPSLKNQASVLVGKECCAEKL